MLKSSEYGTTIISIKSICDDLYGSDPLALLYALRYCALNGVAEPQILKAVMELKNSQLAEWGCKVSDCAIAALHILNIEIYTGENETIKELISTRFYTVK